MSMTPGLSPSIRQPGLAPANVQDHPDIMVEVGDDLQDSPDIDEK